MYIYTIDTPLLMSVVQDVDRLHREVNDLRNTVSAQGKEVERLQKENQGLSGEIETHRLTVCVYMYNIIAMLSAVL